MADKPDLIGIDTRRAFGSMQGLRRGELAQAGLNRISNLMAYGKQFAENFSLYLQGDLPGTSIHGVKEEIKSKGQYLRDQMYRPGVENHPMENLGLAADWMGGGAFFAPKGKATLGTIKGFHGSPHKFKKFQMSKMGTGEGAQAFGHGLYFGDKRSIGEFYAKEVGGSVPIFKSISRELNDDIPGWIRAEIGGQGESVESVIRRVTREMDKVISNKPSGDMIADTARNSIIKSRKKTLNALYELKKTGDSSMGAAGYVYDVSLHKGKDPSEYEYMRWDKTVPENQLNIINSDLPLGFEKRNGKFKEGIKGEDLYHKLKDYQRDIVGSDNPARGASSILLETGIDGIKFPSGTLSGVKKSKDYNYVVFDENAITIDKRY